jgi:WD40 repeat protein
MRVDRQWVIGLVLWLVCGCGPPAPTVVERAAWKGHTREIVAIALAPDGRTLATRGADGVKLWDMAGPSDAPRLTLPLEGSDFGSVAFAPDGQSLAADRAGMGAVVWAMPEGRERANYLLPKGPPTALTTLLSPGWGLSYAPDGSTLAGGSSHGGEDGFVALWATGDGHGVELPPLRRPITSVAYSPDGQTIASGSMDGKLVLWDVATRRERLRIDAGRSYLAPVAFSPDGRVVASANEARWVKLWNTATGAEVGVMKGHVKAVLSLAFAPDGKTLASGDSGGVLLIWDWPSRKMLLPLPSDRGKVWGLAFTPDGRTLISAGEDRLVHLWDVAWPAKTAP